MLLSVMAAYTLTIGLDPPLKLYVTAHNDAAAIVVARIQIDAEFSNEKDEATLDAAVSLTSDKDGLLYESTVANMLGKKRRPKEVQGAGTASP